MVSYAFLMNHIFLLRSPGYDRLITTYVSFCQSRSKKDLTFETGIEVHIVVLNLFERREIYLDFLSTFIV